MTALLDHFLLAPEQRAAALFALGLALLSLLLGRGLGRRGWEGAVLGYLVVIAATNMAVFLCRALVWPTAAFAPVAALMAVATLAVLRRAAFHSPPPPPVRQPLLLPVGLFLAVMVWVVYVIPPYPAAGFDMFQGWFPLYLESAFARGLFPDETAMRLGNGLLATGGLYYQPNMLGPTALAPVLGWRHDLFPAYLGACALSSILALGLLAEALRRSTMGLLLFAGLCLLLFRFGPMFRLILGNSWFDTVMPLAGAATCYFLVRGQGRGGALAQAFAAAAFMVFGRAYGAFYAALLFAVAVPLYRCLAGRWDLGRWVALGLMFSAFSAKEIIQTLVHGAYFPRADNKSIFNPDLGAFAKGTLSNWGLLPSADILVLPGNLALPWGLVGIAVLAACLWQRRRILARHPSHALVYGAPLVLLLLPLALEAVTGYRRGDYSKTYIVSITSLAFLPAFAIAHLPSALRLEGWCRRRWRMLLPVVVAMSLAVAAGGGWWLSGRPLARMEPAQYARQAVASYLGNNHDYHIARLLAERLEPGRLDEVRNRPLMYFYYEPGITLRYFLGGDMLDDWDFWSDPVRAAMSGAADWDAVMERLGWPNLYFSLPGWKGLGVNQRETEWERFMPELERVGAKPWAEVTVEYDGAVFVAVRPPSRRNRESGMISD